MSITDRLLSLVGLERRAHRPASCQTSGFDGYWRDFAALRGCGVTPESAQSVAACYAAVSAISEGLASLPLFLFRRTDDGRVKADDHPLFHVLHSSPNDDQSAVELREFLTAAMLTRGNGYARIHRGGDGRVRALVPLVTERVNPLRGGERIVGYEHTNRDGKLERLLPDEVFHLRHRAGNDPLIGQSPIQAAREVFELASAEANMGVETFQRGAKLLGILKYAGVIQEEDAHRIKSGWHRHHRSGDVAILDDGMDFQPVSMSLEDAEWVAARRFSVEEVARLFKIPPILIGDLTNANYSNSTEMYRWFVSHTLKRHMTAWEQAISRQLLSEAGRRTYYPEHSAEGQLRGDSRTRAEFYKLGIESGWLDPAEVRQLENLPRRQQEPQA